VAILFLGFQLLRRYLSAGGAFSVFVANSNCFRLIHVKTASKSLSTIVSNSHGNSGLNMIRREMKVGAVNLL
jgi:hypothetical protein